MKKWFIFVFAVLLLPAAAAQGAGVFVYENNGDLLGLFVGHSGNADINVYNQSLGVTLVISTSNSNGNLGRLRQYYIYFTVDSCAGTPYLPDNAHYNSLLEAYDGSLYYTRAAVQDLTAEAYINSSGVCDTSISEGRRLRTATGVSAGALPFTYPIAFPLEYRFQNTAVVVPLP
jgi:hypothetical protein